MSYEYRNAVNAIQDYLGDEETRFGASEKIVLGYLADCINEQNDGDKCWPGYTPICKSTYLSRATVRRCITSLATLGFMTVLPPTEERKTNTYVLDLEFIKSKAPQKKSKTRKLNGRTFTDKGNAQPEEPDELADDDVDFLDVSAARDDFHRPATPKRTFSEDDDDELA